MFQRTRGSKVFNILSMTVDEQAVVAMLAIGILASADCPLKLKHLCIQSINVASQAGKAKIQKLELKSLLWCDNIFGTADWAWVFLHSAPMSDPFSSWPEVSFSVLLHCKQTHEPVTRLCWAAIRL